MYKNLSYILEDVFYQSCPRMEQDATRCIHGEIPSINLEALFCKLVLAECSESKNVTGTRDASNESSLDEDRPLQTVQVCSLSL